MHVVVGVEVDVWRQTWYIDAAEGVRGVVLLAGQVDDGDVEAGKKLTPALQSLLWVIDVGALVQEGGQGLVVAVDGGVGTGQVLV